MTVYHPQSRKVEQYEVTDPYAHSLSTNSEYSQVVDLNDSALKPDGLGQPDDAACPEDKSGFSEDDDS